MIKFAFSSKVGIIKIFICLTHYISVLMGYRKWTLPYLALIRACKFVEPISVWCNQYALISIFIFA